MAEAKSSGGTKPTGAGSQSGELREHPLVARHRPDPERLPAGVLLSGYPGNAADARKVRLYVDLSLKSYAEFVKDDILSHWPSDPGNLNAPTHVLLKPDTPLELVTATDSTSAVAFFQGQVISANAQLFYPPLARMAQPTCVEGSQGRCTHNACRDNTQGPVLER